MDSYVEPLQSRKGSRIMIGKGNRSKRVRESCQKYGGFYLGSIGGNAASLTSRFIRKVQLVDMKELGMEAVWKIEVEDFPAFIVIDDKGNDLYQDLSSAAEVEVEENDGGTTLPEQIKWFDALERRSRHEELASRVKADELAFALGLTVAEASRMIEPFDLAKVGSLDIDQFFCLLEAHPGLGAQLRQALQDELSESDAE